LEDTGFNVGMRNDVLLDGNLLLFVVNEGFLSLWVSEIIFEPMEDGLRIVVVLEESGASTSSFSND
jgi:hypothetical protein